jgi:hypothetical protein
MNQWRPTVFQDYRLLAPDQVEHIEKQSLRTLVQTMQDNSKESKEIFDNTAADSDTEVIVIAEDLVQYALTVAECFPIRKRFAGFIDYKQVRWLSTPFGIFPQVLLVDAKASTENNRDTLQQSQLCMDAEFKSNKQIVKLTAAVPPHHELDMQGGAKIPAITTSTFIHFYYEKLSSHSPPYRNLRSIFLLALPHQSLKPRYNPDPDTTFYGQGKHSPARHELPRIRVYFQRLREMCPWRLQELPYDGGRDGFAKPVWRDVGPGGETTTPFEFRGP